MDQIHSHNIDNINILFNIINVYLLTFNIICI